MLAGPQRFHLHLTLPAHGDGAGKEAFHTDEHRIPGIALRIKRLALGQIAAKRGNLDEAESHFANAMKEAKLSRLPMLELLVARNMKKHLLEPNGRDCSVAEEGIDSACRKMNKTREEVAWVLKEGGSVGEITPTVEA